MGRVYRVALAHPSLPVTAMTESGTRRAFFGELRQLGYVEGHNLIFERRSAEGRPERFPKLVAEVIALKPDLIVVNGVALAHAFKVATTTIPVLVMVFDPVSDGLVSSLARPDANVTGVALGAGPEILGKQIDFLAVVVPAASRVAFLARSNAPGLQRLLNDAQRRGLSVQHVRMDGPFHEAQYLEAFTAMSRGRAQVILVMDQPEHFTNARLIAELAAKHRLPLIGAYREMAEAGGLMSYGVSLEERWRRLAVYVDRILKGTKPADLPVEQPTKFELVINLKTARAQGIAIPATLQASADEVIE